MAPEEMEQLMVELIVNHANNIISGAVPPTDWDQVRQFFQEGFDMELPADPTTSEPIEMRFFLR